jgi:hypothetical protein
MKLFKIFVTLTLCIGILFGATSCLVVVREDNGRHKGWFKNSNNPHHPHSTNPGKGNKK